MENGVQEKNNLTIYIKLTRRYNASYFRGMFVALFVHAAKRGAIRLNSKPYKIDLIEDVLSFDILGIPFDITEEMNSLIDIFATYKLIGEIKEIVVIKNGNCMQKL